MTTLALSRHGTDTLKWAASAAQIAGYGATATGANPVNIYCFIFGILGWFIVGVQWNDKAIKLIHSVALGAMLIGLVSAAE